MTKPAPRNTAALLNRDFLKAIPKVDLHVHLDGSIRLSTLIELAKEHKIKLPSYSVSGLEKLVFKERYESLVDYLQGFRYTVGVMQTPEAIERISYEFAQDNQAEGVRYVEVRFAPQLLVNYRQDISAVIKAVYRGLAAAAKEFNARPEVVSGKEPAFHFGIITCAMRYFNPSMSDYYRDFHGVHGYSPAKTVFGLASLELARAVVKIRDVEGIPVVGFDLAGPEAGYPAWDHVEAYRYAHRHFLNKTVHAGEAYGPESIFQAITDLHADRIGHGYHLFDHEMITSRDVLDKKAYVERLAQYIAERRITIEVCLTSNQQTNPTIKRMSQHAYAKMREHKLSVTFCTDNRSISRTTVTGELELAIRSFSLTPGELKNSLIYGFKRSFYPWSYKEKRSYVRSLLDYYEKLARAYGVASEE